MNIASADDSSNEPDKPENHRQFSLTLLDHACDQCSKSFASEYGLASHTAMSHTNQSTFCSECNLTFRSHRTFKTHQQRFHGIYPENLSSYNYLSSNLVLPFSSQQFAYLTSSACEQGRFPLGQFSAKLYACQVCSIAFPSSSALNCHLLNQHEQYEYQACENLLREMILQIEEDLRVDQDKEWEAMQRRLAEQASALGLMEKSLAKQRKVLDKQNHQFIFPTCQHADRTCANLCLKYLSSYNQLIQNYPYRIPIVPKGNPFLQGSIVSNPSNHHAAGTLKENSNVNPKRIRSSPKVKRKLTEQQTSSSEQSVATPMSPRKTLNKTNQSYTRSLSSMSSTSSTSTRSSTKTSRQPSATSLKRSLSPTVSVAVEAIPEKRRRQRRRRKGNVSLSKISDDVEQENGDDDNDIHFIQSDNKIKQRRASNSSVEYVQVLQTEQSSVSSLNNIENLKSKSPLKSDDEIIICHASSPKKKTALPAAPAVPDFDEQIRVRCKICGDIIEGRSQFSQHVLTMHSHLLKSNLAEMKPSPTTVVCSI